MKSKSTTKHTINDRAIGSIGAFRQNNIHRQTAELGYYLAEEYWGRGIMTDAIRQICAIIFKTTDILRVYAELSLIMSGPAVRWRKQDLRLRAQ